MKLGEVIPPALRGITIHATDHEGILTELVQGLIREERFDPKYKRALILELLEMNGRDRSVGGGWVILSTRHPAATELTGVYGNVFGAEGFTTVDNVPVTQIALFIASRNDPTRTNLDALSVFCQNLLYINVNHVFNVADTFWIQGRGLVIAPDRAVQQQMRTGEKLIFKRPDQTFARSTIAGIEMFEMLPNNKSAYSIQNLTKEDVPIGSEVWWINEGTAGAGILVEAK